MSTWNCNCGNAVNDNKEGYKVYDNMDWLESVKNYDGSGLNMFPEPEYDLYRCPACGRMMFFNASGRMFSFMPEFDPKEFINR